MASHARVLRRAAAVLLVAGGLVVPVVTSTAPPAAADAVFEETLVGRTVEGRRIRAFHLADPAVTTRRETVVLFSTMHGDERDTRHALDALVRGPQVVGLDLWVVPLYNPDGFARGTRRNAHGVDLNRNFPYRWTDLDGSYESGPRPASEPETRAVMRFLRRVDPDWVLSFHQPLDGVDTDTKRPAFARRVARELGLPRKRFDCGGVCHGTMTGWFNSRFDGAALTVEYGANPAYRHLTRVVPDQVLRIFGAVRGTIDGQPAEL